MRVLCAHILNATVPLLTVSLALTAFSLYTRVIIGRGLLSPQVDSFALGI